MVRARWIALAWLAVLCVVSCKQSQPRDVPSSDVSEGGVDVKSRRSTALGNQLAWGAVVTNGGERAVHGASLLIVARGAGGAEVGRGSARVVGEGTRLRALPPRYGVRIEVNGIALSAAPERVDVKLEGVEHAPGDDAQPAWKPSQVAWEKALPDGVAFAVEKARCGTVLDTSGKSGTFGCTLGIRNIGTRAAHGLTLRFKSPRSAEAVVIEAPHPTDLPIEPGDALVFEASQPITKPSEMILVGAVTGAR